MGHTCIPSVPALVQLRCQETDLLKGIAGVRADSEIRVFCDGGEICRERGELQLTDYGISRHSHFPAKPQGELSAQGQAERDSTD